jgi:hypothetical protein
MGNRSVWGLVIVAGVGLGLLTGCADKLTRSHYDMIVVDTSTKIDVEKTIGEPTYRLGDQWHYERVDKPLNVFIHFNDQDVVSRKQWITAEEWDDTEEPPADRSQYESTRTRTIDE